MTKRDLVLKVLRNETVERIPVGFWFHFLDDPGGTDGLENPKLLDDNLAGHRKFYETFKPDIVKIMSDGMFRYPNELFMTAKTARELRNVKSIGEDHPWIERQVKLVKDVTALFGGEVLSFYNIFAPSTTFKFRRGGNKEAYKILADFIIEDKDAVIHALDVAAKDLAILARRVTSEGGADGIYLSTQDTGDTRITAELQKEVINPGDFTVLNAANSGGKFNILHICGYEGHRNDLTRYTDYPAQIINWAAVVEGVPLGEGKKIFGGKPVIGGFGNTVNDLLYRGTQKEVEDETARIIAEAGKTGIIIGADCTVPAAIDLKRLSWVRDKAAALS
ncbi:uroporphyrinogen decarboxylase [Spirochaetia bacterium]|nr:uroporphyrinogen decarboxylase [Spirochaetia bacterium]